VPGSQVWEFTDPSEYAARIRATQVDLAVTKAGPFAAKLIRLDLHPLWMQRLFERLPRVAHHDNMPGRAIVSFRTQPGPAILRDGEEEPFGSLQRHREGQSSFQRSTGSTHLASMSLPIADMEAIGATLCGCDLTPPKDPLFVTPPPAAMERLQTLHAAAGHLAEHAPQVIACPEAACALEQALISALADCLGTTNERAPGSWSARHSMIMRKFYAILEANPHGVLYVPEICRKIGVSDRTLAACCHEALGMNPHRYLKLRQLHLARRALVLGDPATTTVTQIATSYGFWELGRFATAYRAQFGERPSATLGRPPDAASILPPRINASAPSEFA